jgi:multidrug efflux pump subunit AcrA (membrane-fusion protein)
VKKGQLIAELDDAVIQKSLAELEGQLAVATDLYNRQESLWKQNIGSEVQYIQAKNNKESLERSIATLKENWGTTKIYAPTSGTVVESLPEGGEEVKLGDVTYVKFGETYYQPIEQDGKNMYEVVDVQEGEK